MKISKSDNGRVMKVDLEGDIDAVTVIDIEPKLIAEVNGVNDLTFNCAKLDYVSSAGLRVFLMLQKMIKNNGGSMVFIHVSDDVMDVFKVTGFVRLFTIR